MLVLVLGLRLVLGAGLAHGLNQDCDRFIEGFLLLRENTRKILNKSFLRYSHILELELGFMFRFRSRSRVRVMVRVRHFLIETDSSHERSILGIRPYTSKPQVATPSAWESGTRYPARHDAAHGRSYREELHLH